MPFVTRKSLLGLVAVVAIVLVMAVGFVWSGAYNVGADDAHTRPCMPCWRRRVTVRSTRAPASFSCRLT